MAEFTDPEFEDFSALDYSCPMDPLAGVFLVHRPICGAVLIPLLQSAFSQASLD